MQIPQNNSRKKFVRILIIGLPLLFFSLSSYSQSAPNLNTAANFVLFTANGAVGNTGVSNFTGDVGTNLGAVNNFGPPSVLNGTIHTAGSVTAQAAADLVAAYNQLFNTVATNTTHTPAFGSGETLTAGVYSLAAAASISGNLVLDGENNPGAVFIFKVGGAFTTGAGASVTLVNGAVAGNVFYISGGATAIGAASLMEGTFIANNAAVSMAAGGVLHGRLFSTTGAVAVDSTVGTLVPVGNFGGTVSSNQIICPGTQPMDLTLSGNMGAVVKWQMSSLASFNSPTDIVNTTTGLTASEIGNLSAKTYIRAVVQSGINTVAYSNHIVVTIDLTHSPDFGGAAGFVLFTSNGAVGNTGTSTVTGNVGSNLGTISGFSSPSVVNGVIHNADSTTAQAATDLLAVYTELSNTVATNTNHAPAFGGGETLTAGVYSIPAAGSVAGTLILDGQGNANSQFIFKIGGAFTTGAGTTITLINGAYAGNVFWTAGGAITMAASTTMRGTLIANNAAISMAANGILDGRMYSTSGAIAVNLTAVAVGDGVIGTLAGNQTICSGTAPANLILTGNTRGVVKWQKATDSAFTSPISIASTATTLSGIAIGNLTATTYFRAVAVGRICVASNSNYVTLIVTPATVGGTVSNNQTICLGSAATDLTLAGNVGTVLKWQKAANAAFSVPTDITNITSTLNAATIGILGATTYFRTVVQNAGCNVVNSNYSVITVSPVSVGGTVSVDQIVCSGTLAQDLTLANNIGAVLKWQSATDSSFAFPTDISNITSTLTGAQIGMITGITYLRAIVQSGVCATATSAYVTLSLSATSWDGLAWSNGAPTSASAVTITGNYYPLVDLNYCSLNVLNHSIVVILSNHNVTLNGALNVETGSSFTLQNNANLIQISNAANTGDIIVQRDSNPLMRLDYILWSSPVEGQKLQPFSPATAAGRFYTYDSEGDTYITVPAPATTDFAIGTGYLIRMPNNHPTWPLLWSGTFTGQPHNGEVNLEVDNETYNAVGNPYPSTIDADLFMSENNISEAMYLWRKTNNNLMTSYATYTTAGGVCNGNSGDPLGLIPSGVIQVGQGFLVKSTSENLRFTNSMRIADNQDQTFRNAAVSRSRIWLNLSSDSGVFSQTMVAYMANATSGVDPAIDGHYFNDSQTALTSVIAGEEFAIQGRALPFDATDMVPLGFKTALPRTFIIALDHVDGLFITAQNIFLKDNLTNTFHDLRSSSYSFYSEAGIFNSRFEIVYQSVLAVDQPRANPNATVVYKQKQDFVINSGQAIMSGVKVFDISGRLLFDVEDINASEKRVVIGRTNEMLLIQISMIDGVVVSKKVLN